MKEPCRKRSNVRKYANQTSRLDSFRCQSLCSSMNSNPNLQSPTSSSIFSTRKPSIYHSSRRKRLYLIRHGESLGQTANRRGLDRTRDPSLLDAGLTPTGIWQAQQLALDDELKQSVQLVISSPLTRALHTAVLGFREKNHRITVDYDLYELGSRVPENTPRHIQKVLKDINMTRKIIDYTSRMPDTWPILQYDGKVNRSKAIRRAMLYLHREQEENCIAIVCHFHVIREIVEDGKSLRPRNAVPIVCNLLPNGRVVLNNEEISQSL
mmetsp:Transcript_42914/g.48752  ORF Transcript_42914/g.48752 Transcript_42914/m.48752 type:complete len:267 (-) Transcript_42914:32-832(-)